MELRNHPRMVWQCRPNWPPHWKEPYGPDRPLPTGEVGILQRVDPPSENVEIPHGLLDFRWNGENYFASLYFDDPGFLKVVCETLSNYIGRAISEIGSLDIPSTDMRQS
jgi:hypothetical protein